MGIFVAPRIGELRRHDVPSRLLAQSSFRVSVVGDWGRVLRADVRVVELWQSGGWSRALGCPRCGEPSRVLRAREGELLCGRCSPLKSEASRVAYTKRRSPEFRRSGARCVSVSRLGTKGSLETQSGSLVTRVEELVGVVDSVLGLVAEDEIHRADCASERKDGSQ